MISVIIPTYNREKTIKRSIESVLNQTIKDIEVIVVDDCSSDSTSEIVNSINDSRIIYEKLNMNKGACAARNRGIELSQGDYIAFQDSDDVWRPNKLESQYNKIIEVKSDIIFCSAQFYNKNGQPSFVIPSANQPTGFINYKTFMEKSIVTTQTILGKKNVFEKIKFDESMPRFQDWDLIIRLSKSYLVYYQDDILVDVYTQDDSISTNPQKAVLATKMIIQKHHAEISSNKILQANFMDLLGNYLLMDKKNPRKEFYMSFISSPRIKTFVKLVICIFGFQGIIYWRNKRLH